MAYRIDYGPAPVRGRGRSGRLLRVQAMTAAFLLLFILCVRQYWPEGIAKLRETLLPGQGAGQAAFQEFVSELRDGEPVYDALTAFCRQILENGQTG